MAHQYFPPHSARRHSIAEDELTGDLEQSIFIFPNPGSRPSTPMSVPTDVSFPWSTVTTTTSRRTSSVGGGGSDWDVISGRSVSMDTSHRSPLVEVWEMSDEDDNTAELDARRQQELRYPLGRQPFPSSFKYIDGHFQLRGREESLISSIDGQGSYNRRKKTVSLPRTTPKARQPSHRLPLLSLLSTLFSIDDTTLHLLTRPSHPHSSPLFTGVRLQAVDVADNALDEKRASVRPELASVKKGIEVASDSSITPDSMFALPLPSLPSLSFVCIWNLVNGMHRTPKKMWTGIRTQA